MQELWSQKKRPLVWNSMVTSDLLSSMRPVPRFHSNRNARNSKDTVGSSVFYAVCPEATQGDNCGLRVMTYACFTWDYAADAHPLKLQRLHNQMFRATGSLDRCTPVGEL
jgi:hypothetical protein